MIYLGAKVEMDEIYLIYKDSIDDAAHILGYVLGTEADALAYCDELNKDAQYEWEEYWYEELKKLN